MLGADFDLGIVALHRGRGGVRLSQSFANFLHENRDLLAADAIIVADSGNWDLETPAITVALRGAVAFNLRIDTLAHASHSGMFGGAVPDAMLADDPAARHAVGRRRLRRRRGAHAAASLETPDYDEAQLRAEAGLLDGVSPIGARLDPLAHLGAAGDHDHRHRRTRRRERLEHARARRARAGERAHRPRAGRRRGVRRDPGAPRGERAVRRAA